MTNVDSFSVSTNILRDADRDIRYIVTPNAQGIFGQIGENWQKGLRSYTLIGSYGTGKSSFLWALEKQLSRKKSFFKSAPSFAKQNFQFETLVGSYTSLIETFGKHFRIKNSEPSQIIAALDKQLPKNKTLVIILDEFGKFLEYAVKNNPEEELYFIQQLAEWANSPKSNVLFITSLHQNFSAYGRTLPKEQRAEWDKVRGRFYELAFNEPVEQLLFLASQRLQGKGGFSWPQDSAFYDLINGARLTAGDEIKKAIFTSLAPFDYLTAYFLTRSLQRYAQNERSLFSFLETNAALAKCRKDKSHFGIRELYTYLVDSISDILYSRDNPDLAQWTALRIAIEKTEVFVQTNTQEALDIIVLIGFINLFGRSAGGADKKFILRYLGHFADLPYEQAFTDLEKSKVIRYVQYRKRYQLFDGTDLDIEAAMAEAESHVEIPTDFSLLLEQELNLPVVFAKQHFLETGTPRFFKYKITYEPIKVNPNSDVDGCINVVMGSEKHIKKSQMDEASSESSDLMIHALYNDPDLLKSILSEIGKLQYVLSKNQDDVVAKRELQTTLSHERIRLRSEFQRELFTAKRTLHWYVHGERLEREEISEASLNRKLSEICTKHFNKSPKLHNELINRRELSTPIKTCRKSFIQALLENHAKENLGYANDKFPPEKTIYLTLLKDPGIHHQDLDGWTLGQPEKNASIKPAWDAGIDFLNASRKDKLSLGQLVQTWSAAPYGLKDGVIQFLLPAFIIANQEEFSLFSDNGYLPFINTEVVELVLRKPESFKIRATDVTGIKLSLFENYRSILQIESNKHGRTSLNQAIRPLLSLVRNLPDYAKNTKKGLSTPARKLRDVIAGAQEPETTLFVDIPAALGYAGLPEQGNETALQNYLIQFKNAIREITKCHLQLVEHLEQTVLQACGISETEFADYHPILTRRFSQLVPHKLPADLRLLHSRFIAPFDDSKSWISAIAHSLVQKRTEQLSDDDVELLHSRIKEAIPHLEGYLDVHQMQSEHGAADAAKIRIYSPSQVKPIDINSRIKSSELKDVDALKKEVRHLARGKSPEVLKMALIKLLEEQIKHE